MASPILRTRSSAHLCPSSLFVTRRVWTICVRVSNAVLVFPQRSTLSRCLRPAKKGCVMEELTERAQAQLHDVEAVMTRLGLGRSKVYELIASGTLRSAKIGRRRVVSEQALTEFVESLDAGGV